MARRLLARALPALIGLIVLAQRALPAVAGADHDLGPPRLDAGGVKGALILCGGREPDSVREQFARVGGGKNARLVVIPTALEDAEIARETLDSWTARGLAEVSLLHTRDRRQADSAGFAEPLRKATAVWISGRRPEYLSSAYRGTRVEHELAALLDRGGLIGGTAAAASCASRWIKRASGAKDAPSFGLLPGAIVDPGSSSEDVSWLASALEEYPGHVGFGIGETAALFVQGRSLRSIGGAAVRICLARSEGAPTRQIVLEPGQTSDLTMLRRAVLARTQPPFPPRPMATPSVPQGALVVCGGGPLSEGIVRRFIELAGGPEAAIVVLPTALPDPLPNDERSASFLARRGARNVTVLKVRGRQEVESAAFLDLLGKAKGIWFGGGRQWRFVDAYEGTKALEAFRDVLRRGGVIGGSSAGATIQGDYLVRGSPLGNAEMMAEGYERGFAFLPGTAVDQHFAQRRRFPDMTRLVDAHPQLLGIGIDESAALIVRGHIAEVVGAGSVHFYDRRRPLETGKPDYESVPLGGRYDLRARRPIAALTGER